VNITTYGLVRVSYEHGRQSISDRSGTGGDVIVRGGVVPGGTAFILLDIEYRDLTYDVEHLIWRAVYDAAHVAIVGPIDASHALAETLAWKDGQLEGQGGTTDAEDAAAEVEAFNVILGDIATFREEFGG
jgi:hypothetical protein